MTARDPIRERDDYLWDGSGAPDAQFEALQRELSPLRWQPTPLAMNRTNPPMMRPHFATLRAAAMLALLMAGVWVVSVFSTSVDDVGSMKAQRNDIPSAESMTVRSLQGSPRIGGEMLVGNTELLTGDWLETDSQSTAQVTVGDYGTVDVEPDSRLRLVRAQANEQRLELARGSLSAFINAPPRLFIIDTPAAAAVDLGCAYDLRVDDHGNGEIEVTLGWVSMENHGVESIVPRGAKCLTRRGEGGGIGTPFYADASPELIGALEQFDFDGGGNAALAIVLGHAAHRDTLTLWHLIRRVEGIARQRVVDRLMQIWPAPQGTSMAAILRGDEQVLNAWRDGMTWSPRVLSK